MYSCEVVLHLDYAAKNMFIGSNPPREWRLNPPPRTVYVREHNSVNSIVHAYAVVYIILVKQIQIHMQLLSPT